MIEFVCTPLHVRIAIQGCHGNHAISQGPNVFIFRCIVVSFMGSNEKLSSGCKIGQIRFCGLGYPISVLI